MEKTSNKKLINIRLQKTKKMAKILQLVPFVRCIILNGSLADMKHRQSSDIDILIIATSGRIFTVRFFTLLLAMIAGAKRNSGNKRNNAGKFCFNYFLTDHYLEIPHFRKEQMNLYCAKNYSQSILVWGDKRIFSEFCNENICWMQKYLAQSDLFCDSKIDKRREFSYLFPISENLVSRQLPIKNVRARRIAKWWEKILIGRIGDWLEFQVKKIQIFKIERSQVTWDYPDLIVYNDREMRFHPPKED